MKELKARTKRTHTIKVCQPKAKMGDVVRWFSEENDGDPGTRTLW